MLLWTKNSNILRNELYNLLWFFYITSSLRKFSKKCIGDTSAVYKHNYLKNSFSYYNFIEMLIVFILNSQHNTIENTTSLLEVLNRPP